MRPATIALSALDIMAPYNRVFFKECCTTAVDPLRRRPPNRRVCASTIMQNINVLFVVPLHVVPPNIWTGINWRSTAPRKHRSSRAVAQARFCQRARACVGSSRTLTPACAQVRHEHHEANAYDLREHMDGPGGGKVQRQKTLFFTRHPLAPLWHPFAHPNGKADKRKITPKSTLGKNGTITASLCLLAQMKD